MARSKRIAVAGGTGGIGSHIIEGLLEIKERDSLHIIILSRSSKPDVQFAGASAPVIGVDYTDVDAVAAILREHQIDTIISTVSGFEFIDIFEVAQQRLLDAALRVPSVHRFAPSEFAVSSEKLASVSFYHHKLPILRSLRKVKETRSDFEFTVFVCGGLTNYLGYGNAKPDGKKAHGHLREHPFILDLSKATVEVPGDGNATYAWTTAEDVGRFTAAATQLEAWPEELSMAGDLISTNKLIEIAESITGKEFVVKYLTEEDILARIDPNATSLMANFYHEVSLGMVRGECDPGTVNLNGLVSVEPMSVKGYLQKWWGN
ncbi:hypothetical protein VNI00_000806 [Paramarasmius palmivorus]|uniref:NmrA-like domain-containing protein n=1 Tax=Paramarasmius palmivorus TaxID=297713 RepID=A0AAW0E615_9AGAR